MQLPRKSCPQIESYFRQERNSRDKLATNLREVTKQKAKQRNAKHKSKQKTNKKKKHSTQKQPTDKTQETDFEMMFSLACPVYFAAWLPRYAVEIWKHIFISLVWPSVHTNP